MTPNGYGIGKRKAGSGPRTSKQRRLLREQLEADRAPKKRTRRQQRQSLAERALSTMLDGIG